jgi:uncharacterized OB-fold protein
VTDVTVVSDDDVFAAYPDVPIDVDNLEHYRGLLSCRLLVNRCAACGTWIYPHRPMCPRCWSWDVAPTPVSGDGTVFMFTVIQQERDPSKPNPSKPDPSKPDPSKPDPSKEGAAPTVVAAVELVEQVGLRYLSRIVNCPLDALELDMPVRLVWIDDHGRPAPAFEPATAAGRA